MVVESEIEVLVGDFLDEAGGLLELELLREPRGRSRAILSQNIQRPQLALSGFLKYFTARNLNVFGSTEVAYLHSLGDEERMIHWRNYLSKEPPIVVISRGQTLPDELLNYAAEAEISVVRSPLPTDELLRRCEIYLERKMSPSMTIHGVMVELFSIGLLILGDSGVGKSETALELLQRGHRFISDDAVELRRIKADRIIASSPSMTKHHMEIRGLGILNIRRLYGASAIAEESAVDLVARLESWEEGREYDRLGLDEVTEKILGLHLPKILVPVQPGRNIAIILEVGAMNQRLKNMGVYSAAEFSQRLDKVLKGDGDVF